VRTAYLSLGSNLGDRWAHLRQAVESLRLLDPALRVSGVYETAPVGGPAQGPYLNCVVALSTDVEPHELLRVAQELEAAAARVRTVRNGPRTLDVDLLLIGDLVLDTPELVIPHPRMYDRGFVLAPLEELDPALVPGGWRAALGDAPRLASEVRLVGKLFSS
jgi:2-amino-4-hydroxy-6-hydroxymethyldihydropteridine diphosphokinase